MASPSRKKIFYRPPRDFTKKIFSKNIKDLQGFYRGDNLHPMTDYIDVKIAERAQKRARRTHFEKEYRATYKRSGKSTYGRYKHRAATKGHSFELTLEQFLLLLNQSCHYCNAAPPGGIDRKDNFQGYTLTNSLPCCKRCNLAKNDMDYEEFLNHIRSIYTWLLT